MVTHEIAIQAFGSRASHAKLTLVQRTDEDFIAGMLADLATEEGRAKVLASAPQPAADGLLELFQPVHRTFQLALVELFCKEPGLPRVDPRRIESAGLVVRRVGVPKDDPKLGEVIEEVNEAWVKQPNGAKAWRQLPPEPRDGADTWDPDPGRRRDRSSGNAQIDRLVREKRRLELTAWGLDLAPAEEQVTTLFVAPPETCKAVGRTILHALVPTASADTTVAGDAKYTDADLDEIVPQYLGGKAQDAKDEPATLPSDIQGKKLTRYDADRLEGRPFMTMLSLLTVALGAFPRKEVTPVPQWREDLLQALDGLTIAGRPGREFLGLAARVLVWRGDGELQMPSAWPTVAPAVTRAIRDAMGKALGARAAQIVPNLGRFETPRAQYVARAFVRIKRDDGCPPKILWSEPTPRFRIRPWHAAGPLPPIRVTLPDIVPDANKLDEIQPNVTFVVPKGLAGFLNSNTAKALLKGSGSQGKSALGWLCGFNIPIITICAFIMLSIVLSLLNIIFWWLPLVKICIPFPSSLKKQFEEG